jgi:beta-lactamase class A
MRTRGLAWAVVALAIGSALAACATPGAAPGATPGPTPSAIPTGQPASAAARVVVPAPAPSGPATAVTSAGIDALDAGLAAYLANLGPRVGVAVTDVTRHVRYAYNAGSGFITASSMKVPIMLTFLSQLEAQQRQPTTRERYLLRTMIENSNNASASALYAAIGNQDGITAFMRQVGLSGLRPSSPARGWGWSTITPRTMAALLQRLNAGTILTAKSRALALDLMENVQPSQQWGLGDTRPAGATVALKNGWTLGPDGLWVANSSGIVTAGDEVYVISVYTKGDHTVAEGKGIVSHICEVIGERLVH